MDHFILIMLHITTGRQGILPATRNQQNKQIKQIPSGGVSLES
jgi:hypothetical protein